MSGSKIAARIANRKGYYYEVKAGKRYMWCACGRSQSQPFCDGSHAGTEFLPIAFRAERDEDVIFCGCKQTGTGPFCDGAHSNLPGGYLTDDPDSPENRRVPVVAAGAGPVVRLDGQCYVFSTARATLIARDAMRYCRVVTPALGALFQSQFYAEIAHGSSAVVSADGRHTVLFVLEGSGAVEISGRHFPVERLSGVYIRPDEAYRVHNTGNAAIKFFISNGPGSDDLVWLERMPGNFEAQYPQRIASIDPSQRHKMAERYYQMLVNREHGSSVVTQFIGNIPLSKAEPHRHLYEEALIFLNGAGVVWTENAKTAVVAGDVLFLPRKQLHSVQCTTPGGFDIVGVIYPGDNPSINY
ncbi:MAG TPA: CDGSH iron-sulfur domain-containing protein [Steroidobacteraceae bacterium]|nr:CDGSH iron-sulfur domain-containing protein [Steroidobacteraceae bacterium]